MKKNGSILLKNPSSGDNHMCDESTIKILKQSMKKLLRNSGRHLFGMNKFSL